MARQVATAAINALRDSHYVLNGVSGLYERSVLMEGSRTNGMFPSNDFTSANFTKTGCTITASAATGPDGVASSMSKLVEDSATNIHTIEKVGGFAATASTVQSASCYAKAAERTWCHIQTVDGAGASASSWVNLSTGAVGTKAAAHTVVVESLANGEYRLSVSWNSNVGGAVNRARFGAASADAVGSYLGDGTSGIYLYGYQVEADQPFSSSYIPTVGGTVTRSADSYSVPFTTPPQAMTLYTKFKELGTAGINGLRTIQIGTNTAPYVAIFTSGAGYRGQHASGATVSTSALTAPAIGDTVELRLVLNADGSCFLGQTINGAAETTTAATAANALGATWAGATLYLGGTNAGANAFAAFLVPYKVALGVKTLAEMQALRSA